MRILHRYLSKEFFVIFGVALLVFTFVVYIGAVIKAIDLMANGVSGRVILRVLAYNIPYALVFSIPISVLTAVLLLFSRLSLDGEITAMHASGIGLWQICAPVLLLAVLLSFVCLYVNACAAPNSHFARRQLLMNIGVDDPLELIEEGRWVRDFPGVVLYAGRKMGGKIQDVILYEIGPDGPRRHVRAVSGLIQTDEETQQFIIDLYDVRIETVQESEDDEEFNYIATDHYEERLDFGALRRKGSIQKRSPDQTLPDLIQGVRDIYTENPDSLDPKDLLKERTKMMVQMSRRFAVSFSCLAFTLVGIPLGLKSRRKDASFGIAISLGIVFVFYFFVILAESLVNRPNVRPDFIIWIPLIAAQVLGFRMMRKQN